MHCDNEFLFSNCFTYVIEEVLFIKARNLSQRGNQSEPFSLYTNMESVAEFTLSSNVYTWFALVLGTLTFIYWQGLKRYNSILGDCPLPGPKPWPWVGSLPDVSKYGGMHKMFLNYFYKYGRVHKMCFGRAPVIVVSDPEIIKQIMVKEFWKFPNRPPFIKPNPPINSGLFISRDETWKRIRNTLTPTFTATKLKQIVPIIDEASQKLSGKMKTFSETGKHGLLELESIPFILLEFVKKRICC